MKRIFSLILAVAMVMGLSVQGFAACTFSRSLYDEFPFIWRDTEQQLQCFGTFETSALTDEQKDFMRECFANLCDSSVTSDSFYLAFITFDVSEKIADVYFCSTTAKPYGLIKFGNADGSYYSGTKYCLLYFPKGGSYIHFSCPYDGDTFTVCHDDIGSWSSSTFIPVCLYMNYSGWGSGTDRAEKPAFCDAGCVISSNFTMMGNATSSTTYEISGITYMLLSKDYFSASTLSDYSFAFIDDDGLLDSDTSEPDPEPEEPDDNGDSSDGDDGDNSSGDEDSSRPSGGLGDHTSGGWDALGRPELSLPSVDSSKVGYDLSVWDSVLDAMLPTLTKVGGIVFIISLIILGLEIVLIIIRVILLSFLYRHWGDVLREQRTTYHVSEQYKYTANNNESHVYRHKGD